MRSESIFIRIVNGKGRWNFSFSSPCVNFEECSSFGNFEFRVLEIFELNDCLSDMENLRNFFLTQSLEHVKIFCFLHTKNRISNILNFFLYQRKVLCKPKIYTVSQFGRCLYFTKLDDKKKIFFMKFLFDIKAVYTYMGRHFLVFLPK